MSLASNEVVSWWPWWGGARAPSSKKQFVEGAQGALFNLAKSLRTYFVKGLQAGREHSSDLMIERVF